MEIPQLSPGGWSQWSRMGWEMWDGACTGHPSLLTCSLAPHHPKMAVPVCWHAHGVVVGMQGSGG